MTLYALMLLVLAASLVCEMFFDRKAFANRIATNKPFTLSIASMFWLYAVDASGVTPGLALLLKLPAIVVLAYATWMLGRSMWRSWRASRSQPRMDAHELMSLDEDIAKADRLRASADKVEHWRARELMDAAIAQAARRA